MACCGMELTSTSQEVGKRRCKYKDRSKMLKETVKCKNIG